MFVPLYWLIPLAVLAAVALLERVLLPGVRVVLRRNVRHLVEELNQKLRLKLQPFKLTKKRVIEAMIVHDPEVALAARQYQEAHDLTWTEVADLVEAYAREIVPTFNVYLYYRLAHWFARRLARALYRVRVGFLDKKAFAAMDTEASVVFVMNHRSNLDYVLVSYLVARHAAISYAVGEWARVWPLDTLIRRLGAYFVRRNTSDPLYRKVLERYVQLSREAGVTQGIFPEGGLTRDGRLREPKLGLLNYVLKRFDPHGPRDLVFVPIGINYDRVL
ncbi:MAG: 1-acyl-sn-glycerol-3-phosphate acyltransferase, partial [Thermoanaerobaculales bacterium]